jgi:hypothetical protein
MIDTGTQALGLPPSERRHLDECGECRVYAAETNALLNLLGATPRVEAPPDFDFRLRARIATVKGQQSSTWAPLAGLWSKVMTGPMGWSRAAAAMAAMALLAGGVTLYATRTTRQAPEAIATRVSSPVVQPVVPPAPKAGASLAGSVAPSASPAAEKGGKPAINDIALSTRPRTGNPSRVAHPSATNVVRDLPAARSDLELSAIQGTRVVVDARGGRPMVTIPQVTYGAQRAIMRQNASAGDGAVTQAVF